MSARRPQVAVLGPLLGALPGRAPGPGEELAALLAGAGWDVRSASARAAPLPRLIEMAMSLLRLRSTLGVAVLMVFSGRGFRIVEAISRLAVFLRCPLVLWLHGGDLPRFACRHPRRVRRVLARADAVVAPSTFLPRELRVDSVEVIPNPLDVDTVPHRSPAHLQPRILWLRALHPIYDPTTAVEALALLRRTHPDAVLTLAGEDRGLGEALRLRAMELGLADALQRPGFLDRQSKLRELGRHDIFLHTNRIDNAPVSLLEAAAAGLPIVATRVGGVPDLFTDCENALLVPPGDPAATAAALSTLLEDPALAGRLRASARHRVERHRPQAVLAAWERLLSRVAQGSFAQASVAQESGAGESPR